MVTIKFDTGGDCFRFEDGSLAFGEVSETIKAVADVIATGRTEGKIRDFYGNTVGEFKIEE